MASLKLYRCSSLRIGQVHLRALSVLEPAEFSSSLRVCGSKCGIRTEVLFEFDLPIFQLGDEVIRLPGPVVDVEFQTQFSRFGGLETWTL